MSENDEMDIFLPHSTHRSYDHSPLYGGSIQALPRTVFRKFGHKPKVFCFFLPAFAPISPYC